MMNTPESSKASNNIERTDAIVFPSHLTDINQALVHLRDDLPATAALLVDTNGQVMAAVGELTDADIVALGALISSNVAAGEQIARITGTPHIHPFVIQEGREINTFIADAGTELTLFAQTAATVPIGWGRIHIQAAARHIAAISEQTLHSDEHTHDTETTESVSDTFEQAFGALFET